MFEEALESGANEVVSEEEMKERSQEDEIVINVYLHLGEETGSAWGCDLSYGYVKINACYRT